MLIMINGDNLQLSLFILKGLCHGFWQIFEKPKFIFVSKETKK